MWEIEGTDRFRDWYGALSADQQDAINGAVDALAQTGPNLKRPVVGALTGSRIPNLKELRVHEARSHIRILFVFDPRRTAILLLGGDKAGNWQDWYRTAIPEAERLYDAYLDELHREGLIE